MAEELLRIENLKKYFDTGSGWSLKPRPQLHAVDGVSLSVDRGETFGVVGESGCGKTTLAKCVVRLYKPDAGRILLDVDGQQRDILSLGRAESFAARRRVQMVFQDPYASLNPTKDILAQFDEPLRIHGFGTRAQRAEIAAEALREVNLQPDYLYRYPHEFSGGQRQRICIAKALALRPDLIVCDEPVSALDVSIQAQILNLMKRLQRERGISYLFIAHDLSVVQYMSERIAVMYLGQIVETASAAALYEKRLHPYTQALLSAVPVPVYGKKGARIVLEGDVPSPVSPPQGCRFHPRCSRCMDICKYAVPQLRPAGADGHLVACHLYDEQQRSETK